MNYREKNCLKNIISQANDYALSGAHEKAFIMLADLENDSNTNRGLLARSFYDIGQSLLQREKYYESLMFFEEALKLEGNQHAEFWVGLASACLHLGYFYAAHQHAAHALETDRYCYEAYKIAIESIYALGNSGGSQRRDEVFDMIEEALHAIYENRPYCGEPLKYIAYIFYLKNNYKGACRFYSRYMAYEDLDLESLYLYSLSLFFDHDTTKSKRYFKELFAMAESESKTNLSNFVLTCLVVGSYYLNDNDNLHKYLEIYNNGYGTISNIETVKFLHSQDMQLAQKYYDSLVNVIQKLANSVWTNRPEVMYPDIISTLEELRMNCSQEAENSRQSFFVRYMDIAAYTNETVAYMHMEDYQSALEACDHALEYDLSLPESLFNKGELLLLQESYDEALACYEKALAYQEKSDRRRDIEMRIEQLNVLNSDYGN